MVCFSAAMPCLSHFGGFFSPFMVLVVFDLSFSAIAAFVENRVFHCFIKVCGV